MDSQLKYQPRRHFVKLMNNYKLFECIALHRERERKFRWIESRRFCISMLRACLGSSTNIYIGVHKTGGYFYAKQNSLSCLYQVNRCSYQKFSLFYIVLKRYVLGHTGCNYLYADINICSRALVQISSCIFCGSCTDN